MNGYNVIYADPPWNQKAGRPLSGGYKTIEGKQVFNPLSNKSSPLPYRTMSITEIANLPIHDIAADNAHLYLWTTNKYLMDAGNIIKNWGFKYSTTLVWCKKPIGLGLGGTYRISTEFLLFATKGHLKATTSIKGTWFDVKRKYINGYPCHSKKPDFFRNMIESVSPGKRIELFAREHHQGWDVFGDQISNSIQLTPNTP